jgi:hypothetical protein
MDHRATPLERAFELARSGVCSSVDDIRRRLRAEGYSIQTLEGPTLLRQLRELCTAAAADPKP